MDRRSFLKGGAAGSAAAFLGSKMLGNKVLAGLTPKKVDIAVLTGTDYFMNTRKAVDALGGIKRFVPEAYRVGLLINSGFETRGAYVKPDISL